MGKTLAPGLRGAYETAPHGPLPELSQDPTVQGGLENRAFLCLELEKETVYTQHCLCHRILFLR